ncbi:SWIM zinc finger domain-containing protein [Luteipulveratus sp. YIM 133132]|uniref:SWIM zinc finger family protein n=1 Tax=Luteipulveratus flavus TaxID=3031728 RepID=UPI0023AEE664|nr:SWIM zinc finger family protein [Luteipulveratus sp. YIM 133132]MDE9365700.1 SWIM zinc finger domain-containing protein [Luteipulveratus sp. YIM 133132]
MNDAAPDASALAAARTLARPGPWRETGCNDVLVWGQCQGSGKTPYQVSIDVVAPAYRCSCPSRKFPCKHALALLLLWSEGVLDESGQVAPHAAEWAAGRAEGRSRRTAEPAKAPDREAQARRLDDRLARMDAGVADLRLWLRDLVRGGLAAARTQPTAGWEQAAARLVDAQLPGLAERVRDAGSQMYARDDWAEHLLAEVGRWWLITTAWQQRETLDEAEQADVRVAVGWAQSSGDVLDADHRPGPWTVLGAHRSDDGRLQQQRTWLRHDDGEIVTVLDFAGYGQALAVGQLSGSRLDVTVARYPGRAPRRAVFVEPPAGSEAVTGLAGGTTLAGARTQAASALATSPWRDRHPAVLHAVTFTERDGGWEVADTTGSLPLTPDTDVWSALALSGGHPVDVFGELEGGRFRPLSVWLDDEVVAL